MDGRRRTSPSHIPAVIRCCGTCPSPRTREIMGVPVRWPHGKSTLGLCSCAKRRIRAPCIGGRAFRALRRASETA